MAVKKKNLSKTEGSTVPSARGMRFAIVYAEWNLEITGALCKGAKDTLVKYGADKEHILVHPVPGSYELVLGAQLLAEKQYIDAVICIGCVVQGDTPHFDYICDAVANGIAQLNIKHNKPVIFGVLTTLNMKQAKERAGGKHGNKGDEAAITAIKMLDLKNRVK
jgi:6,7-dimethyl-8-ribityllumazine synthase